MYITDIYILHAHKILHAGSVAHIYITGTYTYASQFHIETLHPHSSMFREAKNEID